MACQAHLGRKNLLNLSRMLPILSAALYRMMFMFVWTSYDGKEVATASKYLRVDTKNYLSSGWELSSL